MITAQYLARCTSTWANSRFPLICITFAVSPLLFFSPPLANRPVSGRPRIDRSGLPAARFSKTLLPHGNTPATRQLLRETLNTVNARKLHRRCSRIRAHPYPPATRKGHRRPDKLIGDPLPSLDDPGCPCKKKIGACSPLSLQ